MRSVYASIAACALLSGASFANTAETETTAVADEAQPDAEITLKGGSVAAGVGYTWGQGELTARDGSHAFSIKGISLVDVGASNFAAKGVVYHLANVKDFAGNYVAAGAGLAIAGGGTAVYLKNEHGVVIKLIATDVGLKFKLSTDGVHVTLKS